ncbi:MAG TPA: methionine--tRNA ligase [Chitinophagales bacterium]|nr:methionine--tRNA ligase [Chitinophagales bacterium]
MSEPKRYTITAALPYANGPLHIGHLEGAYVAADIYVRHLRLQGKEVIFVCGSDEHGAAITIKAKKENTTPKEIVDKYHAIIRDSFERFGIAFDIYHRTSEPIHYDTSQEFFRILNDKGAFEVIESEQYYDETAKQFLADRYIIGTCPKCGNENAYGDQCEKCGSALSPTDLIHPKSTITNSTPVLKQTKHWFLRLDAQQEGIATWLETKKNTWKSHVYGQCKSWLNDGLKPRAMTRDLDWGIPVPPEIEGSEGKVLYVWLDAPIGYISATKQLFKEIESGNTEFSYPQNFSDLIKNKKADDWKKFWQDDETKLVHFIGKDNIVFHCITFPAILKATTQYILPSDVPANEFMNLEGDKISTSRNWAVWLHEYLQEFPGKEDELRYCVIANMPENKDAEFTWSDFQSRVNNELAANIGNFINRVAVLTHKFYGGNIPVVAEEHFPEIFNEINVLNSKLQDALNTFRFKEAMQLALQISSVGNKFLGDNEPWKLIKTDIEKTKMIMHVAIRICKTVADVLQPLLPFTAHKIYQQFNAFSGTINSAQILFEKITDEQVAFQIEKLKKSNERRDVRLESSSHLSTLKSEITYDDFSKLDLRIGKILEAEKVPKADKLLKLTVDIGIEKRTIVSGIAAHFSPDEIIGKEVCVLVNLAPRKLRGIESNGMILMAEDENGKLHFVNTSNVSAGSVIS